jgi:hypothetical protein
MQEAACKDVEHAFGFLQARFAIVEQTALMWSVEKLHLVMKNFIILHNMILEDERNTHSNHLYDGNSGGAGVNLLQDVTR